MGAYSVLSTHLDSARSTPPSRQTITLCLHHCQLCQWSQEPWFLYTPTSASTDSPTPTHPIAWEEEQGSEDSNIDF